MLINHPLNFLWGRVLRNADDGGGNGGSGGGTGSGEGDEANAQKDGNAGADSGGNGAGNGDSKSGSTNADGSLLDLDGKSTAGERPAYIPEALWDADKKALKENSTEGLLKELETQNKRADGLRKEMGKGAQLAPKDAKDYKLPELKEEADKAAAAFLKADDPFIGKLTGIAHKYGMSQKQYEGFMADAARELATASVGLGEAKQLTDAELETIKEAEYAKIGPNAPRVAAAVSEYVKGLVAQGHFNPQEVQEIRAMAATADGLRVLNKFRTLTGGESIPMGNSLMVDGLLPDDQIQALYSLPEYGNAQDPKHAELHAKIDRQLSLRVKAGRPTYLQK